MGKSNRIARGGNKTIRREGRSDNNGEKARVGNPSYGKGKCGRDPRRAARRHRRGARATGFGQSMWKTSLSSWDLGLLSGLLGMISFMWAHQRLQMGVLAMLFQRVSS